VTDLGYGQSILLGIVQGITEFLPISSSTHLALAQRWMGLPADSPAMFMFDGLSHVGTLVSIMVVFWNPIRRYAARFFRESNRRWIRRRHAWRIALLGVAASIPTAIIGLVFKEQFEADFARPRAIGLELIVSGILLAIMACLPRGRRGYSQFTYWQAALVGVAQGAAILPGISRSGATICTASLFGLRRQWAAQFSFFIAFPAILGATALQFKDMLADGAAATHQIAWGPMMVGSIAAILFGILSLRLLVSIVLRSKLHYFMWYCWLVGGLMAAGLV